MTSPLKARNGIVGREKLLWRKQGRGFGLFYGRDQTALLHILPDGMYPHMWRIQHSDGDLSNFANVSRIRDAAIGIALGLLNAPTGQEMASPLPAGARKEVAATPVAGSPSEALGG